MASRSLGVLTLDLVAKIGGFVTGMTQAERVAKQKMTAIEKQAHAFGRAIGGSLRNAAGNLVGFAAGFASIQAAIGGLKNAIDAADKLNDFNIRLGISAEALSGWGYAAQQSGTDIDTLGKGLIRLQKAMAEALDPKSQQANLFKALGVDIKDAEGNLRSVEQVLPDLADGFKALNNEALETQAITELFGKSGGELDEFLNLGASGLAEMRDRARELGVELSQNTLQQADEFNDTLGDLKTASQGLFTQLAAELLPELKALTSDLIQIVKEGRKAGDIAKGLSNALEAVGFVASEVGNRIGGLGQIIEGLTAGFVELRGASSAVFGGDFKRALDIFRGSDSDVVIGQGFTRLITGASDKVKTEVNAVAEDIRRQFDAAVKPLEKVDKGLEARVGSVFAGAGTARKPKKTGKSDEEKEAEQLKAAYERMNQSLAEQIDLFGKDGEAARIRYELEKGSLKALTDELAKKLGIDKEALIVNAENLDRMREELELEKELDAEHDKRQAQAQEVLDSIREERETLGMSAEQWELYNNIKRAGVNASKENIAAITEETKALQAEAKALEPQIALMDSFREGLEDSIVGVINGTTSIKDAFKDLFDDLAAQITRWIARRLIEQAFGGQGTVGGGSSGGWIGTLLGAFFGGGGRAAGGVVSAGGMYRVNENWNRGPEILSFGNRDYLMMGSQGGRVSPAGSAGGATFGPTNIYVQGSATRETIRQIDRANGRRSTREMARTGR